MKRKEKLVVYTLIGLNLLLLGMLVHVNMSSANAQQIVGRADYAVTTGKIDNDVDAVFIFDRGNQKLSVVVLGKNAKLQSVAPSQVLTPRKGN